MAEPFLSEIRMMSFNFPPKGWAFCNGQLLPIAQNQALFSLVGTTYGGDGRVNFGLPDLRGRTPLHMGSGLTLGERAGEENHTLTITEMPQHIHPLQGTTVTTGPQPIGTNAYLAPTANVYGPANALTSLTAATVLPVGNNQPHKNQQPYLTINFSIALQGIFPSQN